MIKLKDSRGQNSLTLGFVTIAFIVGTFGFIYSVIKGHDPDLTNYGLFVTSSVFPYVAREAIEKLKGDKK